jgi:alpha-methylacyl-CoA racemase
VTVADPNIINSHHQPEQHNTEPLAMTATARSGPLAHLKVLDMSRMYPGAFCTLLLADLGADVLKVESPGAGDGMRAFAAPGAFNPTHIGLNRGKRSLELDTRNPEAAAVLKRLVRWADVVIESNKPGQLDKLGLGYAVMSKENPKLVWCSITGFGDFGPNADAPGHDLTYMGYSGMLSRLSVGPTMAHNTHISLPLAGMMGSVGILAAMAEAERTGVGTRLDVNMCDSAIWTMSDEIAKSAQEPGAGWGAFVSRNVYTCSDGRQVTVTATEPKAWAALCAAMEAPDLADFRLGVGDGDAATARVAECLAAKPAAHWLVDPGMAGGVGPVNQPEELIKDPQLTGRGSLVSLPGSGHQVFANPIRFESASGADASYALTDPPELGADTAESLRDAGFTDDEIVALRTGKVVG